MKQRFKNAAMTITGFLMLVASLLLIVFTLRSMVWVSEKLYPWLSLANELAIAVCVVILLPLALFRRTRGWAASGYYASSFLFGTTLFAYACIVAYVIWGYSGLIVGLVFAGIGVVPVAFLATIFNGYWHQLGELGFATVLTFGTRAFSLYLASKVSSYPASADSEQEPIEVEGQVG